WREGSAGLLRSEAARTALGKRGSVMAQQRLTRGTPRGFVLVVMVLSTFTFVACPADPEKANVLEAPSQAIEILVSPASSQIGVGGSVTLTAQVIGGSASDRANVTWSSSSPG